ncbi:MAG: glycosyltransferase [Chitinispirillaceae bacterium]|nr:glycosyltransferase [Chitinispirillaceae bacterium]
MPAVSVIIPVYNRVEYLPRAVESVLRQSFTDFECIVVDDGSDDGSDRLPCLRDHRIRSIRLENHYGVSRARNEGVKTARAPWIAFLDSDDEWLPGKLALQMRWRLSHPEIRIVQSREIWIRDGIRINPPVYLEKKSGDLFAVSLERCMITPSSVLLQKSLFEEYGGFNEALPACEDYDLWLHITAEHRIGLVDALLLKRYAGHEDQLSATVPALDRFRVRSMLGLLLGNRLTERQRELVAVQLRKKAEILANGFRKRGNQELYERYITIAQRYGRIRIDS